VTRINLISPKQLHQKHLLAEYRELPRIVTAVRKQQAKGNTPDDIDIPPDYVLGKGHMKFFYDKLEFLRRRYFLIVAECWRRKYKIQYSELSLKGVDQCWRGDYNPTRKAIQLNKQRIAERMPL